MPGRPPTPLKILEIRGTVEKKRHAKRKTALNASGGFPEPPGWLKGEGLALWTRLKEAGEYRGVIGQQDFVLLCLLCRLWNEFHFSLEPRADLMQTSRMALLINLGGKFGMNPSDRQKIQAPKTEKPDDPWEQLANS